MTDFFGTPREADQQPDDAGQDGGVSRRQLLVGAGGAVLAGSILAACGGSSSSATAPRATSSSAAPAGTPKRGGHFRLGVTGGGAKDMMDGQNITTKPDQARLVTAFETLVNYDDGYKLTYDGLATSVTQDNPTQWTIRLRQGVEFQNGKKLQAPDVIYSLKRILTKSLGLPGYGSLSSVDPSQITAMDPYTVRLHLKSPDSTIADALAAYTNAIVPEGYQKWPAPQNGTGPFKLVSFTPGQQSVHTRNPNYWRTGQPYFDDVTITDFSDPTAQVNALLSHQIDAMTDVPNAQVSVVKAHSGLAVLISETGGWLPLCMAVDMPPFNDNRVRQAMRLIVDRQGYVDQVLAGYGRLANDLFSPFDPAYESALPQRHQDIAQAKSLLKAAGHDGLTVDLHTTPGAAGMVATATVFATQAKAAGVTVNVKNDPNYYGDSYLKLAFSVDFWGTRNYLSQAAQGMLPTAPFNETHWPPQSGPGSNYTSLYQQALAAPDAGSRTNLIHEMQTLEYNYGGYIIPTFDDLVDGYSKKVAGFTPSKGTLNLDSFGHGFRTIWFA